MLTRTRMAKAWWLNRFSKSYILAKTLYKLQYIIYNQLDVSTIIQWYKNNLKYNDITFGIM
jgi:hypothetical protein